MITDLTRLAPHSRHGDKTLGLSTGKIIGVREGLRSRDVGSASTFGGTFHACTWKNNLLGIFFGANTNTERPYLGRS